MPMSFGEYIILKMACTNETEIDFWVGILSGIALTAGIWKVYGRVV